MKRICQTCGATFDGIPGALKCPDCVAAVRRNSLRNRVCRTCGVTFPGGPRAWYCPDCRAERAKISARQARERKRAGKTRTLGSTDICVVCGGEYTVAGGLQKYCPACAPEAVAAIARPLARERAKLIDYAARKEARRAAAAPIACAVCGKPFIPHDASVTCSPECSAELRRRSMAAAEKARREERNTYQRERLRAKLAAMSPEELAEYRAVTNAKYRERYRIRKENQK